MYIIIHLSHIQDEFLITSQIYLALGIIQITPNILLKLPDI